MLLGDQFSDFYCWVFVQVINIWFKCQIKVGDFQFIGVFIGSCQVISYCCFYLIDNLEWFVIVYFVCGMDKLCLLGVLCYDKLWINSNVVIVYVRVRLKNINVRVMICQVNQFLDVNFLIGINQ